jgi:hypothetical protein
MFEKYHKLQPKQYEIEGCIEVDTRYTSGSHQQGLNNFPQGFKNFTERLKTYMGTDGGNIEHML